MPKGLLSSAPEAAVSCFAPVRVVARPSMVVSVHLPMRLADDWSIAPLPLPPVGASVPCSALEKVEKGMNPRRKFIQGPYCKILDSRK